MPLDKNKIVAEASKYAQKGQFDKAIKCYERVVADDPKDVRVRLKLAETQQKKGDLADAAETFHLCAQAYAEQGFALKAVAVYKQIARLTPDDGRVPERLAALYQQLGLLSDAMGQMQLLAQAHERAGDEPKVIEALRRMADLDPENVATAVKLGELYARGGQPAAALEQFRRAAAALKKTSRTDEYLKVAERVASLSPQDLGLTRELANAYLARKDTKRALAKLQLCFKADPKDVETLTLLAQAFRDLGQVSKTVSVFKELAHVQVERGRADEARATFRRVLELAPDDAEALEGAGQRRAAPAPTLAREEAEVVTTTPWPSPALERTPPPAAKPAPPAPASAPPPATPARDAAPPDVARMLTEIDVYLKYGLASRALEHVNRILAIDPAHPDARARLRDLHARGGDVASAAREGALAVRGYLGAGRGPEALSALNRLRELAPDHPELSELAVAAGEPASPAEPEGETVAFVEGEAMVVGEDDIETVDEDALALSVAADEDGEIVPEDLPAAGAAEEAQETVSFEEQAEAVPVEEAQEAVSFEEQAEVVSFDEPQAAVSFEEQAEVVSVDEPLSLGEPQQAASLEEQDLTPDEPLFTPDEPLIAQGEQVFTPDEPLFAPEPVLVTAPPQPSPRGGKGASPSPSRGVQGASPSPAGGEGGSSSTARGAARASPPLSRKAGEGQGGGDPQAPKAAPTPPPAPQPDAESLGEADFFIQQGLLGEARELLDQLAATYPGHPALAPRLSALEDAEAAEFEDFVESTEAAKRSPGGDPQPPNVGQAPAPASPSELEPHAVQPLQVADGDTFDLGEELASELAADDVKAPEEFQYSVADVFSQFKKGVEQTVRPEDGQTHYDLGIAYKEMGLLDDAVQEFEVALAAGGGKKDLDCLTMVGLCRMAQEEPFQAVDAFSRALRAEGLNVDSAKALHYELGLAYEAAGDPEAALFFLQKIVRLDPRYRDVGAAVARLGGGPGRSPDAPAAAAPAAPEATPAPTPAAGRPGPRKKIGYV